jgi:hypothetical protein
MHNFDAHDAMASAHVERGAVPLLRTSEEGGVWKPIIAPRTDRRQVIHSLAFSDGREWDEHNGWRHRA